MVESTLLKKTVISSTYIGSTTQSLSQRMAQHRKHSRCENRKTLCMKIVRLMSELGIENFYIELLENCRCNSSEELRKLEGELIRELKPDLNRKIEGRTRKTYAIDNAERIREYGKQYKQENKDGIKHKNHMYHLNNQREILEKTKEYKLPNFEKSERKTKTV